MELMDLRCAQGMTTKPLTKAKEEAKSWLIPHAMITSKSVLPMAGCLTKRAGYFTFEDAMKLLRAHHHTHITKRLRRCA